MTWLLNVLVGLVLFIGGLDALTTTMTTQLHKRCCPTFLKATSSSDLVPSTPPKVTPKVSAPEGWSPPTPKPLSTSKTQIPSLLTGSLSLALRLGSAVTVAGWSPKVGLSDPNVDEYSLKLGPLFLSDQSSLSPSVERGIKTPLILYEYEPSPFCKKVREILCFLDIPCEFRPCPRQKGFSDELFERTGRRTVPYLRDPNNEDPDYGMFESEDIIDYLLTRYGEGAEPNFSQRGNFATVTAGLSSVARGLAGGTLDKTARIDNNLMAPITLFGYEASPFVKPVREALCELGLAHVLIPCARGSSNRKVQMELTGRQFQVPFIVDPNTQVECFESNEIVKFLKEVYTI